MLCCDDFKVSYTCTKSMISKCLTCVQKARFQSVLHVYKKHDFKVSYTCTKSMYTCTKWYIFKHPQAVTSVIVPRVEESVSQPLPRIILGIKAPQKHTYYSISWKSDSINKVMQTHMKSNSALKDHILLNLHFFPPHSTNCIRPSLGVMSSDENPPPQLGLIHKPTPILEWNQSECSAGGWANFNVNSIIPHCGKPSLVNAVCGEIFY